MARGDFTLNRGDSKSPRRTRRGIASDGGASTDFVWLLRLGLLTASIASIFGMQRAVVEDSGNGHDSSLPILTGNVTEEPELASGRENSRFRFSAHSDLVLVPVTVTTGNGRAVPGLGKEDFSVFDNHIQQQIKEFTCEDAPAAIGLVFDASDSMAPKLAKAQEAVYALLNGVRADDNFFLIRFSGRPELITPLTSDADEIHRAVQNIDIRGSTALFDAMKLAWLEMRNAPQARKAIILISDGEDNASHITPADFKQFATESDTTVYTLFIGDLSDLADPESWSKRNGLILLDEIARQTGGHMFAVSRLKQLPQITAKIGAWIHAQYVLGYVPSGESLNGRYHKIQVKVAKPDRFPKLHYSWRLGYFAVPP
jgi:Ca-activated chloride channel family protein